MYDICIIGGGAAGMSAAIEAKCHNPGMHVCILEKNAVLGKKIHATGNGKCNLSNANCPNPLLVYKFFDSIGIFTRTDEAGRMYPGSENASDVVLALQCALQRHNVDVIQNVAINTVSKPDHAFEIRMQDGSTIFAKNLLLATGGKAGPQFGSLGEGYAYARALGHQVNRTFPVLSPLECREDFGTLKGIRAKGSVVLLRENQPIATEDGEIQFADDGLSGICVFNLSRFVRLNPKKTVEEAFKEYAVSIDFIPQMNQRELETYLTKRASILGRDAVRLLLTLVPSGISRDILKRASVDTDRTVTSIRPEEMKKIAELLKNWRCEITGVKGWKKAQCTGGGVPLNEIDEDSCESKLVNGLYFAGELLDYDGPSGGYNLHFAWETGIKAGRAMADEQI